MSTRWKFFGAATAATLAIGLVAGSCSSNATINTASGTDAAASRANTGVVESSEKPRLGGRLSYGLFAESNGWNPALNQWGAPGLEVAHAIFDTITSYDENSQVKPFLAESFDHNPDFTEWSFKLRPNIKLHNGKPVNADVVIRNQNYLMKSPTTGHAYRYSGVTAFTKTGDLTYTVSLNKPSAVWPISMASQLGVVADPDWLESNDGLKPIGSGPFVFDSWEIDKKLKVKKNADYWRFDADNTRLPYLDSIEFRVLTDTESRTNALKAADVDVIQTLSGQQLQTFQQLGGYQVYADSVGESRERMVMLNTQVEPFNDPDVRLALAYATDNQAFSDITSNGFNETADGFIAPNSPWHSKTNFPQHDPDKARELISKAKAKHGGKITFTLESGTDPEVQLGSQALQQQWAEVGIDVKINLQEQAKLIINVVTGNYAATIWTQFDSPNPFADGVWWDPEGATPPPSFSLNFARNRDDAIGDALHAGAKAPTVEEQRKQIAIVQERLTADIPYIWLVHERVSVIAAPRVVNLVRFKLPDGSTGLDLQQGAHQRADVAAGLTPPAS